MADHLALVTGAEVEQLLTAALAGVGGRVVAWSPRSVHHQPRAATTASYGTTVDWGTGSTQETLMLSAGRAAPRAPSDGVVLLGDGRDVVAAWRFPTDPELPGLATATDPRGARAVLDELGVPGFAAAGPARIRVRTFRPLRRAVIQVEAGAHSAFLRVVRPTEAAGLHHRHELMRAAGLPVPRSWGWTPSGIVALEALPGVPLHRQLRSGGAAPTGSDLLRLLSTLPDELCALPARRSWTDDVEEYARVIGETIPDQRSRAHDLAAAVAAGLSGMPSDGPVHGDFHGGQLLVTGSQIRGLLDLETAGPGRRADDVATVLAHLEARACGADAKSDAYAQRLGGLAVEWRRSAEQVVDATELRLRVAGTLLGLATGPFRTQRRGWAEATSLYLHAVQRWVNGPDPRWT